MSEKSTEGGRMGSIYHLAACRANGFYLVPMIRLAARNCALHP